MWFILGFVFGFLVEDYDIVRKKELHKRVWAGIKVSKGFSLSQRILKGLYGMK